MTGLAFDTIEAVLQAHGVTCEEAAGSSETARWSCWGTTPDGSADLSVAVEGEDARRIRHVTALVTQAGRPDAAIPGSFLGDLAGLDYRGAAPDEARDWVVAWLGGASGVDELAIGHAVMVLDGSLESCSLDIVAPDIAAP